MTRVLLVSGSTRDGALHTAALRTAARHAPPGITAVLFDGLRELPAFVPGEAFLPESVTALRQQAVAADALFFCTPQYAGSLPGSLKNLLDWLVDGGELTGKPAAWLSVVGPGQDDGARASLESVLEHAGARLLRPACIRIPLEMSTVGADGLITDSRLHMALQDMVQALIRGLAGGGEARPQPSWQAHSSVYPVIQQQSAPGFRTGPPKRWPSDFS
ncbi:NAD(P)H-dependent oxidoreductase [Actinoplanes sp. NPDC051861]|uniref:NADPH-dependent FMN reductase n=1 Tax=Actinoplanes sp. NPDC051861 TaxID=3155170 RepID=UPI003415426E